MTPSTNGRMEGDSQLRSGARHPAVWAFVALVTVGTVLSVSKPLYNWDMLPYMAIALSHIEDDRVAIHTEVYRSLEEVAPPEKVFPLVGPDVWPYREAVAEDPEAFWEQVPFYSVKPVYPLVVLAVHALGANLASASVVVSALAYAATCLLLLAWLLRHLSPFPAAFFAALVVAAPPLTILARLSTPDALFLLTFLAAMFVLIERASPHAAMLTLLASMAIRPNVVLFYGLLGFYLAFLAPQRLRISVPACAAYAVASIVVFFGLRSVSANYPWTTFFYHSWVAYLPHPADFQSPLGLGDHLLVYLSRARELPLGDFGLFLLIGGIALLARARSTNLSSDLLAHILLLVVAFFAVHWILYPGQIDRIYAPQYLLIAVVAILTAATSQAGSGRAAPTSA